MPDTEKREKIIDMYDSGMTMREIAAKVGVSHQAVHQMFYKVIHS